MRSLQVQVRSESLDRVLELAEEHGDFLPIAVHADRRPTRDGEAGEGWSLAFLQLPNRRVGAFVHAVRREIDDAEFILTPIGTLPLRTPLEEVEERVRDVSRLSTIELVLASLQSVGAWKGMVVYSVLAGAIAAYGLIFDMVYLLVAAMLINPMGAPALVSVTGLAIGDARMFGRGGARFLVSLGLQASAALGIGTGYALRVSTGMIEQVTALSTWAVVVALAAGAAGALTQVKSDRDSLVSGTAAGFMVAAALAPPAAVLGLSVPLGRGDYFVQMAFLLALQFFAIAAGGWVGLLLFGVKPAEPSIGRGSATVRNALLGAVVAVTVVMVAWQSRASPGFRKADLSRAALEIARDGVDAVQGAWLVESSAHFTRADLERHAGEVLLVRIVAERGAGAPEPLQLEEAIREAVHVRVLDRLEGVVTFVEVTILPGGPDPP